MVLLALTLTAIKQGSTNVGREELQGWGGVGGGTRVLIEHEEEREGDLEDKFTALWRSLWGEEEGGGRGGRNQTGWTMRAHTDALCLMSR